MAAKAISAWCVGALVAGSYWLGAQASLAADPPSAAYEYEQMQPMPNPTLAPQAAGSQTTATGSQLTPTAAASPNGATVAGDEDYLGLSLPLSPPGQFWARADYLMWFTSGMKLPPLVTTSPAGTPVNQAGVLGQPGTTILYGNDTVGNDGRSGVRTTVGMWLDCCHQWGIEFDFFTLGEQDNNFEASSNGDPILARPYFDVTGGTGTQSRQLVAYPGISTGTIGVNVTDGFQSAGVDFTHCICCCESCCCDTCNDPCNPCSIPSLFGCRTDLLVGFRYFRLNDSTDIYENDTLTQLPSTNIMVQDNFTAKNEFYGTEVGLRTTLYRGRWSLAIAPKIALGANHETVDIDGTTVVTSGSSTVRYNNGVLAGPTNSGTYQRDAFAVIPQLNLEIGYQLTRCWRAFVGYDVLYWGDVVRSGNAIDLTVDSRNVPPNTGGGLPFPAYYGNTTAFWAQGVNIGTEFRF
jgi:hypothetical protein